MRKTSEAWYIPLCVRIVSIWFESMAADSLASPPSSFSTQMNKPHSRWLTGQCILCRLDCLLNAQQLLLHTRLQFAREGPADEEHTCINRCASIRALLKLQCSQPPLFYHRLSNSGIQYCVWSPVSAGQRIQADKAERVGRLSKYFVTG